jgi:hypothetical protein
MTSLLPKRGTAQASYPMVTSTVVVDECVTTLSGGSTLGSECSWCQVLLLSVNRMLDKFPIVERRKRASESRRPHSLLAQATGPAVLAEWL